MAGEWLAKKLDGKGQIVELQGTTGAAPANDRKKGFGDAIEKHKDMRIIKSQTAGFERTKGKEVMEAILHAERGKINAVYAHNDAMALGAIEAIKEAGMKPGTDIIIVSIDGIKSAFEAMVEGSLNATVECTPLLGPAVFDTIDKVLAGKTVDKWIKSDDKLFEQSEAAKVIDKRKY
jgi:simple sugar transport system substrate-binding protein